MTARVTRTTRARNDGTLFQLEDTAESWKGLQFSSGLQVFALAEDPDEATKRLVRARVAAGEDVCTVCQEIFAPATKLAMKTSSRATPVRKMLTEISKRGEPMNEPRSQSTMRQICQGALGVLAAEITKRHEARGDPISRAKAHVEAYRTAKGRELVELRRHRLAHLTHDEFTKALAEKAAAAPKHVAVLVELNKRAVALVEKGDKPTIEQARVAVRAADRDLAARAQEARRALR